MKYNGQVFISIFHPQLRQMVANLDRCMYAVDTGVLNEITLLSNCSISISCIWVRCSPAVIDMDRICKFIHIWRRLNASQTIPASRILVQKPFVRTQRRSLSVSTAALSFKHTIRTWTWVNGGLGSKRFNFEVLMANARSVCAFPRLLNEVHGCGPMTGRLIFFSARQSSTRATIVWVRANDSKESSFWLFDRNWPAFGAARAVHHP